MFLIRCHDGNYSSAQAKFRCGMAHNRVETGRFKGVPQKSHNPLNKPHMDRFCIIFSDADVGFIFTIVVSLIHREHL